MRQAIIVAGIVCCWLAVCVSAEDGVQDPIALQPVEATNDGSLTEDGVHTRTKRTLFLKKKLIGAGLLGFGLGVAKGYKLGYHTAPEVHHVYLAPPPPPTRYVEYVEKPVFVQKIRIEKAHDSWSQPDPIPYGSW